MDADFVIWEPGLEIPLEVIRGRTRDLLPVGAPYWRGITAYRVRQIENADPVRIHIERDPAREELFYDGLPEGATIWGGRNGDTGDWHFEVFGPDRRLLGWSRSSDAVPDAAAAEAVEAARLRLDEA